MIIVSVLGGTAGVYFASIGRVWGTEYLPVVCVIFSLTLLALFFLRTKVIVFNSLMCALWVLYVSLQLLILFFAGAKIYLKPIAGYEPVFLVVFVLVGVLVGFLGVRELGMVKRGEYRPKEVKDAKAIALLTVVFVWVLRWLGWLGGALTLSIYLLALAALLGLWGLVKAAFVARHTPRS